MAIVGWFEILVVIFFITAIVLTHHPASPSLKSRRSGLLGRDHLDPADDPRKRSQGACVRAALSPTSRRES